MLRSMNVVRRASILALVALAGAAAPAMAQGTAVQVGGSLTITTGAAQDDFSVIVGPVAGEVLIFGIPNVTEGVPFVGVTEINISTGLQEDKVRVETFSEVIPTVRINTGEGNGLVEIEMTVPPALLPVVSNLSIVGGGAEDRVYARINSLANNLRANWGINGGNGLNESSIIVESTQRSAGVGLNLDARGGLGQDKFQVDFFTATQVVDYFLTGLTGAGDDEINLNVFNDRPATVRTNFRVDMGAGLDKLQGNLVALNGTSSLSGAILGGDGNDIIDFNCESNVIGGLLMDGGNGNDYTKLNITQALRGVPRQNGGAGDDLMELFVQGARLATPQIDGGPGFDIFNGFGNTVNVEQVN